MIENDTALRERLRAGDPLAGATQPEAELLARLARRVAALEPQLAAPAWRSLVVPLAVSATAAVAAVALLSTTSRPAPSADATRHAPAPEPAATGGAAADGAEARQVQFETPGGTRIVWVLDPNLAL